MDKKEKAIDDFANALENLNDDDAKFQAYFQKGICLRRLGDLKNSIQDLLNATKLKEKSAAAHNNLGLSYFESGDYNDAIDHYGKALKQVDGVTSVHYNNRGLAYYHDGKLEEALNDFNKAI